jgi:hypothetical protein
MNFDLEHKVLKSATDRELWQLAGQMHAAAKTEAKGDVDLEKRLFQEKFLAMDKALQARFALLMVQEVCGHDTSEKLVGAVAAGRGAEITAILEEATRKSTMSQW